MFGSQRGLDSHLTRNNGKPCDLEAKWGRLKKKRAEIDKRNAELARTKFKNLGELNNIKMKKRKQGEAYTKKEKQNVIRNYNSYREDGLSKSMSIFKIAKSLGSSTTTIRKIVKEIAIKGDFVEGPYPKTSQTIFEKLTIPQRDAIRSRVHDEIRKVNNKEEGASFPTNKSLHEVIQKIPGIPKWSVSTTTRILRHLGFLWLKDNQVNSGLLSEDQYTVNRRAYVCKKLLELEEEGAYMIFLDESYINLNYTPGRKIQDTTIHTSKQANDQGLTNGFKRTPGKGERLILIGAGGMDGWLKKDIIKRKKGHLNTKDDMDGDKFNAFVTDAFIRAKQQYPDRKLSLVVDNASYHTKLCDDMPKQNWTLDEYKQFCYDKSLPVPAYWSKKAHLGHLVKQDFVEAAKKYVDASPEKYQLERLCILYDILLVRLPPYHPELNPIEQIWARGK